MPQPTNGHRVEPLGATLIRRRLPAPYRSALRDGFARLEREIERDLERRLARRRRAGLVVYLVSLAIGVPLVLAVLALLGVLAPPR